MRRIVVAENRQRSNQRHSWRIDGHQDHRLLLVTIRIRGVRLAHENEDLAAGIGAAGGPPFAPVDDVVIAIAHDGRFDIGCVGRGDVRLGHGECRTNLPREQRLEPLSFLFRGAVAHQHFHVAGVGRVAVERLRGNPGAAHDLAQRRVL